MDLPVERILWAPTNSAHNNHLHVVGLPRKKGVPPTSNPGMTDSIEVIYSALELKFGPGAFYKQATAETGWTHMGIWNRRRIAGSSTWSQHAYANAIDIGPYYGVEEQQKFYDFLTGKDDMPLSDSDVEKVADKVVEKLETAPTIPDQDDGIGRRGWTHGIKVAWGNSNKILDAIEAGAGQGISASQIDAIAEAVRQTVQEELAGLTLKSV